MEAWKVCLLVFGLILLIGVQSGLSIKCYICNSGYKYQGKECHDRRILRENADKYLKDCAEYEVHDGVSNGTYKYCRTFKQDVNGDARVIRQCASGGNLDRCIERTGTKGIKLNYCHCDQDGCNSANSLYTPITMIVTVTVALWALIQRT